MQSDTLENENVHHGSTTAVEPRCDQSSGFAPHAGKMTIALKSLQETPLGTLQERRQALTSELAILDAVIKARTPKATRKSSKPKAEAAPSEPKRRGRQRTPEMDGVPAAVE